MGHEVGSVVISVDAELGWGFHDLPSPPEKRVAAARAGWATLLECFRAQDIPATWAVVGHLFLEDCDGVHADHPTPDGWFAREREDWANRPELRFGWELVDRLVSGPVDHDVGGHTFSHVVASHDAVTEDVFRAELAAAADAAAEYGLELRSFVYPRNAVDHRRVLAEFGYEAYRGGHPAHRTGRGRRMAKVADVVWPDRLPLVRPTVDEYGMVDVPASLFLYRSGRLTRSVVERAWNDPVVVQATRGIDRAAEEDGVFHLWLHPNNLVEERDVRRIRSVLRYLRKRADETDLRVETMRDVARRVRERPTPPTDGTPR